VAKRLTCSIVSVLAETGAVVVGIVVVAASDGEEEEPERDVAVQPVRGGRQQRGQNHQTGEKSKRA